MSPSPKQPMGTREVLRRIALVREATGGLVTREGMQTLLLKRVRERFSQGVSPDGTPWAVLKNSTRARKKSSGEVKPLVRTGLLRDSIDIIKSFTTGLIVGNTGYGFRIGVLDEEAAKYGKLHNYGLGGQTQRRFLGLGASDLASVKGYATRRIKKAMKET